LRAASLPIYGYDRNTSPNLQEIAQESIIFESHFANYPGTPISISQMFTGRLMSPMLMSAQYAFAPVRSIPKDLLILPKILQEAGYRTGLISSHPWFSAEARILSYFNNEDTIRPQDELPYASFEDLMPAVKQFIEQSKKENQPFFLYIHTMDTHRPTRYHSGFHDFRQESDRPPAINKYDSECLYTDYWTGKVVSELKSHGLWENSIFVFTSDHGEDHNEMGPGLFNRGHGATVRRAQVHVPLVMRLPNGLCRGMSYKGISQHISITPTLIKLMIPDFSFKPYRFDGIDLSRKILTGDTGYSRKQRAVAYTHRFWGIYSLDKELYFDQWTGSVDLFRVVKAQYNYPKPLKIKDDNLKKSMSKQLVHIYKKRIKEFIDLPINKELPARVFIGIPTHVVHQVNGSLPTYERLSNDNKWYLEMWQLLESEKGEQPPPIVLSSAWVPGYYNVYVRIDPASIEKGFQNSFTIEFLGESNPPVTFTKPKLGKGGILEAGLQKIGKELKIRISNPIGGVAIEGFNIVSVKAKVKKNKSDPDLEKRLKALGYVK